VYLSVHMLLTVCINWLLFCSGDAVVFCGVQPETLFRRNSGFEGHSVWRHSSQVGVVNAYSLKPLFRTHISTTCRTMILNIKGHSITTSGKNSSAEAESHSPGQDIPYLLWNHVHRNPPATGIRTNPVHSLTACLFKIHFNIVVFCVRIFKISLLLCLIKHPP
jgi:hypothetical protein